MTVIAATESEWYQMTKQYTLFHRLPVLRIINSKILIINKSYYDYEPQG